MSRGLGKTQRAILAYLAGDPSGHDDDGVPRGTPIETLAAAIYETDTPTESEIVATRRAVRGLAAGGHITAKNVWYQPELGRLTGRVRVHPCDDVETCKRCKRGEPRYEGRWVDEEPSHQYPGWKPPIVRWAVKHGYGWHCGPGRVEYDSLRRVEARRLLTDHELDLVGDQERRREEHLARLADRFKSIQR